MYISGLEVELPQEGRNFRKVPEDELPGVLELLATFLPYSVKFHQTLRTYLRDRDWDFDFYVAKTWPVDPIVLHFPGQTRHPNGSMDESFGVFCPPNRLELLELVRTEDVLIDWTKPVYLNFPDSAVVEAMESWLSVKKVERLVDVDIYVQKDPPPDEMDLGELQGEECTIQELRPEHSPIIHNLYPGKTYEDLEVFSRVITRLPGYGVFSKGELASWMIQGYYGAMQAMQTLPEFRRKGYGLHIAQALSRKVRSRGYIPYVLIRPDNAASFGLYQKLGFVKAYSTTRAVIHTNGSEKQDPSKETAQI